MSRAIKIIFAVIPVLIAALVVVLYFSLNSIVKNGVEAVGPKVLGADVMLNKADISLFSGKGQIKGVFIGNPEGFNTESAFRLGEVRVAVDVPSIFSDKLVIQEIVIDAPEITYETSGGKNNIEALLENINKFTGAPSGGKAEGGESPSGEGGKVQINNFVISNASVNLSATILQGKKLTLPMTDIHLKDIGRDGGGATMSEAFQEVFTVLNSSIAGVAEAPLKSAGGAVEKTLDQLKGFFD